MSDIDISENERTQFDSDFVKHNPYIVEAYTQAGEAGDELALVFHCPFAFLDEGFDLARTFCHDNERVESCYVVMQKLPKLVKGVAKTGKKDDGGAPVLKATAKIKENPSRYVLSYDLKVQDPRQAKTLECAFYDDGWPFKVTFTRKGEDILLSDDGNIVLDGVNNADVLASIKAGVECVFSCRGDERGISLAKIFSETLLGKCEAASGKFHESNLKKLLVS